MRAGSEVNAETSFDARGALSRQEPSLRKAAIAEK
jgi:hypothetical protein